MSAEINVSEIDKEISEGEDAPYELFGIPSYLSLMKKYPNARDDILRLRESKNKALIFSLFGAGFIGFLIGYTLAMYVSLMF